MKNLLGIDVDESKYFEIVKPVKTRETIKSEFRRMHGHKKGCYCKDCNHFLEGRWKGKKYFKCVKMGLSHSDATDIRKSDVACNLYDQSDNKIFEVVEYLKTQKVECKVADGTPEKFIAVFSYGDLSKTEILEIVKESDLKCIMFGSVIDKNERKRGK